MRTGSPAGTGAIGASVDELYRRYAPEALAVARSITRNPDDAADAVAEAFAGVLEAMSGPGRVGPEAFRPYLLAAARNASIDVVRRAGRSTPTDEAEAIDGTAAAGGGPSDRLLAGEDRAMVAEAFAALPPRWRAVLWLTEVERLAAREAALLLGVTPNNVSQLAVRARARLRQQYVQLHVRNHATGDCLEATEHLGGLVAGDLTPTQARRVRGHLAECAACRARLAELDDIGLSLRRAAATLPFALAARRFRRRWSMRRAGHSFPGRNGTVPLAGADPSVPAAMVALGTSPVAQQVAASVVAGLLALGVGAAVVRHDRPPPRAPEMAAVVPVDPDPGRASASGVAAPPPPAPPEPAPSTTTTTTTNTTPPAPAAAPTPPPFSPRGRLSAATPSFVAQALVPVLAVHDGPGTAVPVRGLANPQPSGAPLVLLVTEQRGGWLQVLLPVRPNGSTGWVRSDQVTVASHPYRIVVELAAHRITAYQGTEVLLSEPIGVGTAAAPTPGGLYFIKELFQPLNSAGRLNPGGPYGPYAYGLSGFSEVLDSFGGGDGQFGIHGTNDPAGLGFDVSHGCIRMSNEGITYLAGTLPLGVPVEILP
ncbi:MAG: sigma-70 family RNA polymerase sigma factor [Acidimicrobiales bacterium]